jgi:hypothetical protein
MLARIQSTRRHMDALRIALLSPSPEEIVNCLPALEEAVSSLHQLEKELLDNNNPQARLEIRVALQALQNDLQIARRLIEHGAALYRGWANLLAAAAGGYVATGAPAPLAAVGTVSLEG